MPTPFLAILGVVFSCFYRDLLYTCRPAGAFRGIGFRCYYTPSAPLGLLEVCAQGNSIALVVHSVDRILQMYFSNRFPFPSIMMRDTAT